MKEFTFITVDRFANRSTLTVEAYNQNHAINKAKLICKSENMTLIY